MKMMTLTMYLFLAINAYSIHLQNPSENIEQLFKTIKQGNIIQLKALIKKGVDLNISFKHFGTPFYYAVLNKNKDIIKLLIDNGVDVNSINDPDHAPLLCAAAYVILLLPNFLLRTERM